jgi:hypothetical protein
MEGHRGLTTTKSWKVSQLQNRIVRGDRLESDVRVPALLKTLLLLVQFGLAVTEDLGGKIITDDADFIIGVALE